MEAVRQQLIVEDESDVHGFFLRHASIINGRRCLHGIGVFGSALHQVRPTPDIVSKTLRTAATSRSPRSIPLAAS